MLEEARFSAADACPQVTLGEAASRRGAKPRPSRTLETIPQAERDQPIDGMKSLKSVRVVQRIGCLPQAPARCTVQTHGDRIEEPRRGRSSSSPGKGARFASRATKAFESRIFGGER